MIVKIKFTVVRRLLDLLEALLGRREPARVPVDVRRNAR